MAEQPSVVPALGTGNEFSPIDGWALRWVLPKDRFVLVERENAWHSFERIPTPATLNQTHEWTGFIGGERIPDTNSYKMTPIPTCRRCLIQGYEDVPAAFVDCVPLRGLDLDPTTAQEG